MKADFGRILSEAIRITRTNKRLWVFAFVLAALGYGGGSYSSFSNPGDLFNRDKEEVQQNKYYNTGVEKSQDITSKFLPAQALSATPAVLSTTTSTILTLLKGVPVALVIVLVLATLALVSFGFAISYYGTSWAQSSLIRGVDKESETPSLYQMSDFGKKHTGEVIKIRLIPLVATLLFFALSTLIFLPFLLIGGAAMVIGVILLILWFIVALLLMLVLSASVGLGVIAINIEGLKWKPALKKGFHVFKTYFVDVVILAVINCCSGCLVGIALIIITFVLGLVGLLTILGVVAMPPFVVIAGPIVFLLVIGYVALSALFSAVLIVFQQATWILLYKQLVGDQNVKQ